MGFQIGDHVENVPATVDGIVYRIKDGVVWFADEYVTYRVSADSIRPRYEPFDFCQRREITEAWPALFQ